MEAVIGGFKYSFDAKLPAKRKVSLKQVHQNKHPADLIPFVPSLFVLYMWQQVEDEASSLLNLLPVCHRISSSEDSNY